MYTGVSPVYLQTLDAYVSYTQTGLTYCSKSGSQYRCPSSNSASSNAASGDLPSDAGRFD